MKVKELIEKLSQFDGEMLVVTPAQECGGSFEITVVKKVEIAMNVSDKWYRGEHEVVATEGVDDKFYQYVRELYEGYKTASAVEIC